MSHLIRASISRNFGDLAFGQIVSSFAIKLWSPTLSLCLVRCGRDHVRTVWGAITLISSLSMDRHQVREPSIRFNVIHVGGTIRSCQPSAVEHARMLLSESGGTTTTQAREIQMASASAQRQLQQEEF